MPDRSGVDLLPDLATSCPGAFVIMITAYGNLDTAIEAFQLGAVDYVLKPLRLDEVVQKIERLMGERRRLQEIAMLRHRQMGAPAESGIVGSSEAMAEIGALRPKVVSGGKPSRRICHVAAPSVLLSTPPLEPAYTTLGSRGWKANVLMYVLGMPELTMLQLRH